MSFWSKVHANCVTQHASVPLSFFFTFRGGEFSCLRFSATSQISLDSPVAQPSWRALWGSYPGDNATMQYLSIAAPQVTEPSSTGVFHPSLVPPPLPPVSSTDARRSSTVGATILIWIPRAFFRRTGFLDVYKRVCIEQLQREELLEFEGAYRVYAKEKCGMCEIRVARELNENFRDSDD